MCVSKQYRVMVLCFLRRPAPMATYLAIYSEFSTILPTFCIFHFH